jgi:hypothetical protein
MDDKRPKEAEAEEWRGATPSSAERLGGPNSGFRLTPAEAVEALKIKDGHERLRRFGKFPAKP